MSWFRKALKMGEPRREGQVIYTPHECQPPLPEDGDFCTARPIPVGTIWECWGDKYRPILGDWDVCYDQWILTENSQLQPTWVLHKRSI